MRNKRNCFATVASVKTLLNLGLFLCAGIITTADEDIVPKAENVRWVSLDFTTILSWTTKPSDYTYTVLYSMDDGDWLESADCIRMSDMTCDLTTHLMPLNRQYSADVKTEPAEIDFYDVDDFPHTYSPHFNPYKESNISAVEFSVEAINGSKVIVTITDPVTSLHDANGKQRTIRDILQKDLKYKISYHKAGSTGKRDIVSDSSVAEVSQLDSGQSYCFMVAAFIPTRPKATQMGTWSTEQCTRGNGHVLQDLSLGAWVGAVFILLTVLIIIITVTVLCCRWSRQRNRKFQTSQSSVPV